MKNLLQKSSFFIAILIMTALACSDPDPCEEVNCGANGTCVEGTCECDPGYIGTNCETEEIAKFIGYWKSTDYTCGAPGGTSVNFDIQRGAGLKDLLITFEGGSDLLLNATYEGNTITIPFQEIASSYEGTMVLNMDVLTINLNINNGIALLDCTATATL